MAEATQKGRKATSYEVAKLAGVSQATVSLVLSDKGARFGITPETETRVREAAASLAYVPNSLVRSIRRGRTDIVGVYGRDRAWSQRNGYWNEALSTLHVLCADLDRELLIYGDHPNKPITKTIERMLSGIVDGLIVQPSEHNEAIEALTRSRLPLVAIGDPYPEMPSVSIDNVGGIQMAVTHLVERGRRSLAFLNFAEASFGAPLVREQTFLRAAQADGVLSAAGSVRLTENLSDLVPRLLDLGVDAVVCINDEYAYRALQVFAEFNVRVPEQIALVGFDGLPVPFAPMRLTTLVSPIGSMCRQALEMLIDLIDGKERPHNIVLPVDLSVGETT